MLYIGCKVHPTIKKKKNENLHVHTNTNSQTNRMIVNYLSIQKEFYLTK